MIQLATDSNASRTSWRPASHDGKVRSFELKRGRNGHVWPFLSREAARPLQREIPQIPSSDSGS